MRSIGRIAFLAMMLMPTVAWSQGQYPTVNGPFIPATVMHCLNAQGLAVPATSAGTCVGSGGGSITATATAAAPSYSEGAASALSLNLTGDLRTISKQSGTWTVTGAGGTFPVTGAFFQATQPISAASLPLPSGAATEATLALLRTDVQSDVPNVTGPLNAAAAVATKSLIIGGQFLTTQPTMSNTQQASLLFSPRGAVYVMTGAEKLLVTPDSVALPANQSVNVAQINGVTPLMGDGVTGTGSHRFTLATNGSALTTAGFMSVKFDQTTPGTTNATSTIDPCSYLAKTSIPISQTANAQLLSGTSAKKTYVCSIFVLAADAENVSLVGGTGTVCATGTGAIIGSTTAAAGPNLLAGAGWTHGNGAATVAQGATNADNVCLFQSASGRVAGVLTYVQN